MFLECKIILAIILFEKQVNHKSRELSKEFKWELNDVSYNSGAQKMSITTDITKPDIHNQKFFDRNIWKL